MAVNLRATATLNTKPYIAGIKAIKSATESLNKTTVGGSNAVRNAVLGEADARTQASRAASRNAESVNTSQSRTNKLLNQGTVDAKKYNESLGEIYNTSGRQISQLSKMTAAQQAYQSAVGKYVKAADAQAAGKASGLEGPAYQKLADATSAAEERVASTRRRVNNETTKLAQATEKAANAQRLHSNAMASGAADASVYANKLANLSSAQLKTLAATNQLRAAEQNLASKLAVSGGAVTPAVLGAQSQVANATRRVNELAAAQSAVADTGAKMASGLSAQRYLYHDMSRQARNFGLVLAALPAVSIATAAVWEKSFADVRRTADPTFSGVEERVNALRKSLVGMAQAMPTSFTDITAIATLGNQMGVAAGQTAEFTRAVTMFSATSGVSVDITATAFGRLKSIMGDSAIGFMDMSDAILKVGVNSVATESEIINVSTQVSSIAAQAGFSTKEIIGLSGALASVRVPPELSRGLITRVFGQIDKAVNAGGTGLETLARISGTTSDQFKKNWGAEGSADLFNSFLKGIRDAGPAARSELESLGITSVRDVPVTLRLANAADSEGNVGELLTQTLNDANAAAGETQRQYTIMADTVVGKLKILGNNLLAFFDAAGSQGLGVFGGMIENVTKFVRNLTRSLDDAAPVFGIFGATNGDVLGFALNVSLAASALLLLGSAYLKSRAAFVGLQSLAAVIPGLGALATRLGLVGAAGTVAGGGLTKAATGASALGKASVGATGGIIGIGLALAAIAWTSINAQMAEGSTNASDLAESLAGIDVGRLSSLEGVLAKIQVAGPAEFLGTEMNTKPFKNGIGDLHEALDLMDKIRERNTYELFGKEWVYGIGKMTDEIGFGAKDTTQGITLIDEAVQQLVDGGNSAKASKMLQEMARNGKDLRTIMNEDSGKNIKAFLENAFDIAGVEMTDDALNKFAKGTLPAVTDALYGLEGASKITDELFEGDFERLGQFAAAFDQASAAFIDFGSSIEKATKVDASGAFESFSLTDWTATLKTQVQAQQDWSSSMSTLAKFGSTEVIESFAKMGPAGAEAAKALAAGLLAGSPEAIEALAALQASVEAEAAGMGNSLAEEMAAIDWTKGIMDGTDLGQKLVNMIDSVDLMQLQEASVGVGKDVIQGILKGLAETGDVQAALNALKLAQPVVEVSTTFDEAAAVKGLAALERKIQKDKGWNIDLGIDTTTTVADLRKFMDDPTLAAMDIDANLTLTEAYAQSREFQVWAESQGIDIFLGADTTAADFALSALLMVANGSVATTTIQALTSPAEGSLWNFVTLADGTVVAVQINAETGEVDTANAMVVQNVQQTATKPIEASDAQAQEAIRKLDANATAKKTKSIEVTDNGTAAAVQSRINGIKGRSVNVTVNEVRGSKVTQANGGVMQFYANGGIARENHVAQIAPAGAMRVWAEAETGGEAYIPLAQSKRARSEAILDNVATRFGYTLQPQNYTKYADGGMYNAQQISRARYGNSQRGYGSPVDAKRDISFTIVNPVVRDPFEDAWEHSQQLGVSI